jgi:Fe2+ transport system protein FeoA
MIRRFRAARLWKQAPAVPQTAAVADSGFETEDGSIECRLGEIPLQELVELVRIDLPAADMEPLLELGLLPGCQLCPVRRSPFGDPVLRVEGALIALRREMAHCLCVRRATSSEAN